MGQATSAHGVSRGGMTQFHNTIPSADDHRPTNSSSGASSDSTSVIPDECLALIFQFLSAADRKNCSLVCRRWLAVEGQSRHRLALNASSDIVPHLEALLNRFDSVAKLALRCDRKTLSLNDAALALISSCCPNLTSLKIRGCREISDQGMYSLAQNCKSLRKFSCGSCTFGAKGMNALSNNSSSLEELAVKRLGGTNDGSAMEPINPGAASSSLKSITLEELYNGQCFESLIVGSKYLRTLKILRCLRDWDGLLEAIGGRDNSLVEIHLERMQVSDIGLMAIAKCHNLETLHLLKVPDCSDYGISAVAENCRFLRKLHIDGWRMNRIGDAGLVSVAKNSVALIELVLISVNPSFVTLSAIASNCQKLERLALCRSETIGDVEVSCIAAKCMSLKKLCLKSCQVTDSGVKALAFGCPNLVKLKIKKCSEVSNAAVRWLREMRAKLDVNLDTHVVESESLAVDARTAEALDDDAMVAPSLSEGTTNVGNVAETDIHAALTSNNRLISKDMA